jgi:hypothetical protein
MKRTIARVYYNVNTYFIPMDSIGFQLGKNYLIRTATEVTGEATDILVVQDQERVRTRRVGENTLN